MCTDGPKLGEVNRRISSLNYQKWNAEQSAFCGLDDATGARVSAAEQACSLH